MAQEEVAVAEAMEEITGAATSIVTLAPDPIGGKTKKFSLCADTSKKFFFALQHFKLIANLS